MMRAVFSMALLLTLAACATVKTPQPTGGSRADATVLMSFEFGSFEKPIVNWETAATSAAQRCGVWGYTGAEPFGGAMSTCNQFDPMVGCVRTLVTMTYQCTGTGTPPPTPSVAGP